MFMRRGSIRRLSVIIPLVILISLCAHSIQQAEGNSAAFQEIPAGQGILPEDPQGQGPIRSLCEQNNLSYALVLAVYQAEGIDNITIDTAKSEIEKLAYYRNYWAARGYADEFVFDLMLLSNHYGLEGCQKQMEGGGSADPDSYVQRVADFKYNLEQNQGV